MKGVSKALVNAEIRLLVFKTPQGVFVIQHIVNVFVQGMNLPVIKVLFAETGFVQASNNIVLQQDCTVQLAIIW